MPADGVRADTVTRLRTYLNDHLAGSVAAIELVGKLAGGEDDPSRAALFRELAAEIREDQTVLQTLLGRVGGEESTVKKAAGWLAEKLGGVKLHDDIAPDPALARLEALETLVLGIQGKLALWTALEAIAGDDGQMAGVDLARMRRRAEAQHGRVERERIAAAQAALGRGAG